MPFKSLQNDILRKKKSTPFQTLWKLIP
jgi:4-coumarate--CoA ligase